jgi:hypothetical protein
MHFQVVRSAANDDKELDSLRKRSENVARWNQFQRERRCFVIFAPDLRGL